MSPKACCPCSTLSAYCHGSFLGYLDDFYKLIGIPSPVLPLTFFFFNLNPFKAFFFNRGKIGITCKFQVYNIIMSHLYTLQNDHHQKLVTIHHHTIGSFCPLTPHPLPLWEPPLTSAVSGVTNILNLSITHSPRDLMMNTIKVGVSEVIIFCVLPSRNTQK